MQPTDFLSQTGGLQAMARELGISESEAATGATALMPAVLGGFKKQATQSGGAEGLGGLLGTLGGGSLLDDVVSPQPTDVGRGNAVLGKIFGDKEVSRTVAEDASARTGLQPSVLKKMLPMLAMLAAGYMAKQRGGAGGGLGDALGGALGGGAGGGLGGMLGGAGGGGGLGGVLGGMLGGSPRGGAAGSGGGLGSMLDMDGDGNPLDDILRMARGKKR